MKLKLFIQALFIGLIIFSISCNDDEPTGGLLVIDILSGETTLKPDSSTTLEVGVLTSAGFMESNVILEVSGNGSGSISNIEGAGTTESIIEIDFTAGSNTNEDASLIVQLTDNDGITGGIRIDIVITDLDFPSVFVVNEGNFQRDNGSISSFNFRTEEVIQGHYLAGATIQNARPFGDSVYLVTNAPDKVDIIRSDFSIVGSVDEGLDNPIDVAIVGDLGYVTNWGDIGTAFTDTPDSYVAIFDVASQTVTDSIMLPFRPQDIIAIAGYLYISHEAASVVSVIDTEDNSVTTIETPFGSSEMAIDIDGNIVVLCSGGSLIQINPLDKSVTTIIDGLTTSGFNEKMALDVELGILYFLGASNSDFNGQTTVFSVDLGAATISATEFITGGAALYGIGVNPETHDILLGDNNSFIATGTGFVYDQSGTLITEFATGIGPNGFLFF